MQTKGFQRLDEKEMSNSCIPYMGFPFDMMKVSWNLKRVLLCNVGNVLNERKKRTLKCLMNNFLLYEFCHKNLKKKSEGCHTYVN